MSDEYDIEFKGTLKVTKREATVPPPPPPNIPPAVPPTVPPVSPPVTVAPTLSGFPLVGRFRYEGTQYARGQHAINFSTGRVVVNGHPKNNEYYDYSLPPESQWSKQEKWWDNALPPVRKVGTTPVFWNFRPDPDPNSPSVAYGEGWAFIGGTLHVAPAVFYDMHPPGTLNVYAELGGTTVVNLPRQHFAGFIKGRSGPPLLGCGGSKSGQGFSPGPTAADWTNPSAPKVLIDYPFNATVSQLGLRQGGTPGSPDYYCAEGVDTWYCKNPRLVNGVWRGINSDGPVGGGLQYDDGSIHFWCAVGTGRIDYGLQTRALCDPALLAVDEFVYRKDATGRYVQELNWPRRAMARVVTGQEMDPQGRIYLASQDPWGATDVVVEVTDPRLAH